MTHKKAFQITLSASVCLLNFVSYAALPVNSVVDGRHIQGGAYGNTVDHVTTFKNSAGGGLWLQAGQNLRGVEVDTVGNLTNNGGAFHFYAPGQVVRLDGNIDVRSTQNGAGAFLGNGGKVFVDSAYLYQGGNIYANGLNGGLVQFNVGSATLTGNARIEAKGFGGEGGVIAVNASGPVDMQRQTVLDSSGRVAGTIDNNLINIEGSLVNLEGTLQANGVQSRGGTIRIVSTGLSQLDDTPEALQTAVNSQILSTAEANGINTRMSILVANYDGDTRIASGNQAVRQAQVFANGSSGTAIYSGNNSVDPVNRAGDGGTIIITAQRRVLNGGWLLANGGNLNSNEGNGGNGGTISINAAQLISSGRITVDGGNGSQKGGNAGLAAFSYLGGFSNFGVLRAMGGNGESKSGNGGLVVFGAMVNPNGNGMVAATNGNGGINGLPGAIIQADPTQAENTLIGQRGSLGGFEVLVHAENLLTLKTGLPMPPVPSYEYSYQFWGASYRSVLDTGVSGSSGKAMYEYKSKLKLYGDSDKPYLFRNLIVSNGTKDGMPVTPNILGDRMDGYLNVDQSSLNTLTLSSAGRLDVKGASNNNSMMAYGRGLGGGRLSAIGSTVSLSNIVLNGGIGGGSVNLASWGDYDSSAFNPAPNLAIAASTGGILHGGSIIGKANGTLAAGGLSSNGGVIGGVQQLLANVSLRGSSLKANGGIQGGMMVVRSNNELYNWTSYQSSAANMQVNGGLYGGYLKLQARHFMPPNPNANPEYEQRSYEGRLEARGLLQDGSVQLVTTSP
jgi:hypothetical protein